MSSISVTDTLSFYSRHIMVHLTLLYQPRWYGATLAITPHHFIIFHTPLYLYYLSSPIDMLQD